ncbi:mycothiol conjugate amidase Mca [Glaciihabitans sp. INWT7]|uniref:mycothiol conjugate amidase Mca n=1 Tax=Glaciihabitans sp. INWT7 TaxID=2596912 RepID=UPI0016241D2B|nr:mycothiol conjugate amidase Mca [Glaciihabitans sp. INWT7]QNE47591.1 mycothiol conjugate amidase Mca [Glaciihabitans sp. INWT7]
MTQRLLAVHAHPDDESSKGAATYAHYRSIGTEVLVVSCTGGERGDIQNEALESTAMANRDMAGLRRIEMANAQAAIGFEHRWLGYQDSGLPENDEPVPANSFALIPLEISAEPLVKIIREFRPQVLVTYDETGGYPHPDHIRTHDISLYAYEAAADASRYPDAGEPWQISKVYFDRIFNAPRIEAMYQFLLVNAPETPQLAQMQEFRERMKDRPVLTTTQVPVGDFFDARDTALRAHASQVAPDSAFFFWPNDLQRQAWPFEDFQLALSLVESPLPETDLFAGIPAEEAGA